MKIWNHIRRTFNTFGLEKDQFELIRDRIYEDNRRRLLSASLILSIFLFVMFVVTSVVTSLHHNRNIYLATMFLTLVQAAFAHFGKTHRTMVPLGVYSFMSVAFSFGIYQGIITAPEEQTASFVVLMVAVPVWFTMKPSHLIQFIYLFAAFYVACVLQVKTGYVRTSDIVNTLVYTTASALISTYYTFVKSKRFYAEYLTEKMSTTDMLTGLGNRHAYMEAANRYEAGKFPDDLTIIYLDVNELKRINDTLGHHAGDELICGAARCIETAFAPFGGCYRTGGDEFIVMGELSEEKRIELCAAFEKATENWKGSWGQELRVSYGGAASKEVPGGDLMKIAKLADSRLYEAKALYYSTKGIDRREQQKAYRAACESYIRVVQVDLVSDIYRVIHAENADGRVSRGITGSFSEWIRFFDESGNVHPDDVEEFRSKTDLQYLQEHFRSGKRNIHVFYRRQLEGRFCAVMMELIAVPDYSEENQMVYLYVKNIDREG